MAGRKTRLASLAAVLATLIAGIGLTLLGQGSAQAHGVTMTPGSRTYLCRLDAKTSTGALDPTNPACKAALAASGANALYNWFAVLDSNAGGRGPGYVPDGKLCSAGDRSPYDFTGYNAARSDWPRTHLTSGKTIQVTHSNWGIDGSGLLECSTPIKNVKEEAPALAAARLSCDPDAPAAKA